MVRCGACNRSSEPREDGKVKCEGNRLSSDVTPWWDPNIYHPCGKYKRDWEKAPLTPPLFYLGSELASPEK